jgi:hypothetical protein
MHPTLTDGLALWEFEQANGYQRFNPHAKALPSL